MASRKKEPVQEKHREILGEYTLETIDREQLKDAPYNPKYLPDENKRRLKKIVERQGLVMPIVWNRRTGHLVDGHQRVSVLDSIKRTRDYSIRCIVVDMTEQQEREANVALNNLQARGEVDMERYASLLSDNTLSLDAMGFDTSDVYRMFGDAAGSRPEELMALGDRLREVSEKADAVRGASENRDSTDFYLVFVFRDPASCSDFLRRHKLEDNRFQSGEALDEMLTQQRQALKDRE